MSIGSEWTNLIEKKEIVDGVEVLRGACSQNARDPNAPEFMKWKKDEHHSWLAYDGGVDRVRYQKPSSQKIIRKRLTRNDF